MNTITKRIITFIFVFFTIFLSVSAHSGRTDSNGGHFVGGSNEYHYHHGKSAHQHFDGECIYDIINRKIIIFIVGVLLALYINVFLEKFIFAFLNYIFFKFKKTKPTPEEHQTISKKINKIYNFILIILFVIELIVWFLFCV